MKKIFITALSVLMLSLIGCGKTGSPKEIETESIPAELETKTVAKTEKETESQKDIEKYELNKVEEFSDNVSLKQKYTFTFKDYYLDNEGYPYEEYIDDLQDVNNTFFICEYSMYIEPLYDYTDFPLPLYDILILSDYFNNNDKINVTLNIDGTEIRCKALCKLNDEILTMPFPVKQFELFKENDVVLFAEVDKDIIEQAQNITITNYNYTGYYYQVKIK